MGNPSEFMLRNLNPKRVLFVPYMCKTKYKAQVWEEFTCAHKIYEISAISQANDMIQQEYIIKVRL